MRSRPPRSVSGSCGKIAPRHWGRQARLHAAGRQPGGARVNWDSLGGSLESTPAVTSWAENEMQVFCIFTDGQLWSRYWDGQAWHEWHVQGGELTGSPAACSWGADRIDVFARG